MFKTSRFPMNCPYIRWRFHYPSFFRSSRHRFVGFIFTWVCIFLVLLLPFSLSGTIQCHWKDARKPSHRILTLILQSNINENRHPSACLYLLGVQTNSFYFNFRYRTTSKIAKPQKFILCHYLTKGVPYHFIIVII